MSTMDRTAACARDLGLRVRPSSPRELAVGLRGGDLGSDVSIARVVGCGRRRALRLIARSSPKAERTGGHSGSGGARARAAAPGAQMTSPARG